MENNHPPLPEDPNAPKHPKDPNAKDPKFIHEKPKFPNMFGKGAPKHPNVIRRRGVR